MSYIYIRKRRTWLSHFLILLFSLFLASCGDEVVSNKYCSLPAHFLFTPVNSISQLNSSCNSMGEWCTIIAQNNQVLVSKPTGEPGKINITADVMYHGMYLGLSGLIVGLPNTPELGEVQPIVTCYDLACRNCYEERNTTPRLSLKEGGYAHCSKCQRTYNLNNVGQVNQGDAGKPLYRYRVYYGNNTLSVDNP